MSLLTQTGYMVPFQFSYGANNFLYEEDAYIGEQDIPLDSSFGFHIQKPQVMQHTIQLAPEILKPAVRPEGFTIIQVENSLPAHVKEQKSDKIKHKKRLHLADEIKKKIKERSHDKEQQQKKRGRPPKPKAIGAIDNALRASLSDISVEELGSPKNSVPTETPTDIKVALKDTANPTPKKRKSRKKDHSPQLYKRVAANSVRSIPCFFFNCTYNYKRPGSTIVEISDRPLLLASKFDGFVIRSCKKHHDRWKCMEKPGASTCEICRGINVTDEEKHRTQTFKNSQNMEFTLCRPCAERQSKTLGLDVELTLPQLPNPNEEEGKEDAPKPKIIRRKRQPKKPKIAEGCETPVEEPKDEEPPQITEYMVEDIELSTMKVEKQEVELEEEEFSDLEASGSEDDHLSMEEEDTERRAQLYSRISQRFKKQTYDPEEYELAHSRKEEKRIESAESSHSMRQKVKVHHQYFETIRSLSNKVSHNNNVSYAVYRRSTPPKGWSNYAEGVKYLPKLHWSESLHERLPTWFPGQLTETSEQSVELFVNQDDTGSVGLFSLNDIPNGVCLGEFTGEVIESVTFKKFSYQLLEEFEVDATESGNEFRFIRDSFEFKIDPNVRFELVDGHILVIANKHINKNEQLYADYGDEYRDRVTQYMDMCDAISQHNAEHLSEAEQANSAFSWFIEEGFEILKQRCKVTIPIQYRAPSKKGLASTLNVRHGFKNQTEWGYVAQLAMLDLDRAREDCWVTFRPGRYWNSRAFEEALSLWLLDKTKIHRVDSEDFYSNSSPYSSSSSIEEPQQRNMTHTMNLVEVPFNELTINNEARLLSCGPILSSSSSVHIAEWRGFPVVVRFSDVDIPQLQNATEGSPIFYRQCKISELSHPNIVTCYGYCSSGEKYGTIMEYMNLGSLQKFITEMNPSLVAKYLPRIAMDVARAMEHIHSKGIVFGRLKSSNVLLKGVIFKDEIVGLEVKVDIDITTLHESNEEQMGPFLAYEERKILKQAPQEPTADIFSYGMLLNHLFSEGDVLPKDACKYSATLNRFPQQWKELIIDCTQKDATERPQSFSSVVAVLLQMQKL